MMRKLIKMSFAIALLSLVFLSCQDDEKNARIEVWLTDDPGDFQEVNVDVQGVEIHSNEGDNEKGWQSLDVTPQVYDLLKLTNNKETLLGDIEIPGGRISQIRLKLGNNNTVKVDDQTFDLSTPSGQQSGLKVGINQVLAEGITYKIVLDFDAAKSVIKSGDGTYLLKPVIRALTEAKDGIIKGKVEPAGIVSIAVMLGDDTITTTTTDEETGEFTVGGLEAGVYKLVFDGPGEGPTIEKTDVNVETGVVTDVGSVAVAQ